jgi:hypothetical protein
MKMKMKRGFKGPALKDFLILIVPLHLGVSTNFYLLTPWARGKVGL